MLNQRKEWFTALTKIVTPNMHWNPESTEFVCDTYRSISSKSCTRKEKGKNGKRVCLKSEHQNMMSGKDWAVFFHYMENKQDLCNLFANFIRKSYFRDISDVPVVIANNMETWFVTDQNIVKLFENNHEEADTHMVLHALYKNTNVVIVSKDTDVLILLVYMHALKNITSKWCMKKTMRNLLTEEK